MRLVTHNMLKCNIKGVENGYPFIIEPEQVEQQSSEFNRGEQLVLANCNYSVMVAGLVEKLLNGKIEWHALQSAAANLGLSDLAEYSEVISHFRLDLPPKQHEMFGIETHPL